MAKNTAVLGIYSSRSSVEGAIDSLRAYGIHASDIYVLFSGNAGSKELTVEKSNNALEGTEACVGSGAVVGGNLGWLVGVGGLAIAGVGRVDTADPILEALAGLGAGRAFGGIAGRMIGVGIPVYEAKRYGGQIRKGGLLLSVHSDKTEWTRKAKEILQRTGGEDISTTGEASSDDTKSDQPVPCMHAGGEGIEA